MSETEEKYSLHTGKQALAAISQDWTLNVVFVGNQQKPRQAASIPTGVIVKYTEDTFIELSAFAEAERASIKEHRSQNLINSAASRAKKSLDHQIVIFKEPGTSSRLIYLSIVSAKKLAEQSDVFDMEQTEAINGYHDNLVGPQFPINAAKSDSVSRPDFPDFDDIKLKLFEAFKACVLEDETPTIHIKGEVSVIFDSCADLTGGNNEHIPYARSRIFTAQSPVERLDALRKAYIRATFNDSSVIIDSQSGRLVFVGLDHGTGVVPITKPVIDKDVQALTF